MRLEFDSCRLCLYIYTVPTIRRGRQYFSPQTFFVRFPYHLTVSVERREHDVLWLDRVIDGAINYVFTYLDILPLCLLYLDMIYGNCIYQVVCLTVSPLPSHGDRSARNPRRDTASLSNCRCSQRHSSARCWRQLTMASSSSPLSTRFSLWCFNHSHRLSTARTPRTTYNRRPTLV